MKDIKKTQNNANFHKNFFWENQSRLFEASSTNLKKIVKKERKLEMK
jgi:hypothetical protein